MYELDDAKKKFKLGEKSLFFKDALLWISVYFVRSK